MARANNKIYPTGELDSIQQKNNAEVREKEAQRKSLGQKLQDQRKVEVVGAPMYQAYFGSVMTISINGIPIYVPLDGRRYAIPESYAAIFNQRIGSVNEDIELEKRRNDVKANFESYPGELDLVRPV